MKCKLTCHCSPSISNVQSVLSNFDLGKVSPSFMGVGPVYGYICTECKKLHPLTLNDVRGKSTGSKYGAYGLGFTTLEAPGTVSDGGLYGVPYKVDEHGCKQPIHDTDSPPSV